MYPQLRNLKLYGCKDTALTTMTNGFRISEIHMTRNLSTNSNGLEDLAPQRIPLPTQAPFLPFGLNTVPAIEYLQKALVGFHDATGASWAASIVGITITYRFFISLVVQRYQAMSEYRFETLVKPELERYRKEQTLDVKLDGRIKQWSIDKQSLILMSRLKKKKREMVQKHNCAPSKSLIMPILNLPFWLGFTAAIRNLMMGFSFSLQEQKQTLLQIFGRQNLTQISEDNAPEALQSLMQSHRLAAEKCSAVQQEMATESFLHLDSLMAVDSIYILPITAGVVLMSTLEISRKLNPPIGEITTTRKVMINGGRVFVIGITYFISSLPPIVLIYWITSSLCNLLTMIALSYPSVRQFLKIPTLAHQKNQSTFTQVIKNAFKKNDN